MPKKQAHRRDGIYERPDRPGLWMSFVDEYGKRRQKKPKAPTLTQAREDLSDEKKRVRKAAEALANGEILATADTFSAVAERYLNFQKKRVKAGEVSAQELVRQEGIINKHLVPFFKGMKIATIRRSKLNAYIESRTGEVSAGSIIKECNTLKHLFNLACDEWEIIPVNPAKRLKVPEAPEGRTRHLDPPELKGLLEACPQWLRPIAALAVSTGMRRRPSQNCYCAMGAQTPREDYLGKVGFWRSRGLG
jgi:hypothetical protein